MTTDAAFAFAPPLAADHLELVFLASTLTPAVAAGWAYSATPAPAPKPAGPAAARRPVRLAVVAS